MPLIGFYSATKWAVEALHESLAAEVKPFGIKVTLVEPGPTPRTLEAQHRSSSLTRWRSTARFGNASWTA